MATYGITSAGFVAKPLSTIQDEVDAGLRTILGDSAGTEDDGSIPLDSMAGQLKSLIVDPYAAFWDLGQAIVASLDPNQSTGSAQDAVCAITGTLREAASFSTVVGYCTGDPLTFLPSGRVATVSSTNARFDTTADATIAAATAWAGGTGYSVGDVRTNVNRIYYCITSGTSAGSGGPTTTLGDITDNTVHWKYLGEGTGYVALTFQAEASGAIGANAGTLSTIATPVSGWKNVTNVNDAVQGAAQETDSLLRARRDAELAAPGNTTRDAIRANILKVNEGSTDPNHAAPAACEVFVNATDVTDPDGVPPHAVEILVQGGTDADIALAVWNSVGAGTRTYGNQTSSVTDSEGNTQTVKWSRPVQIPIYVTATAYYDASQWPASSDALVAQYVLSALLTYASAYPLGTDARTSPLNAAMMRGPASVGSDGLFVLASSSSSSVPGLLEVSPIYIGTSPSPASSTSIAITSRQLATFNSANCNITATSETP